VVEWCGVEEEWGGVEENRGEEIGGVGRHGGGVEGVMIRVMRRRGVARLAFSFYQF
jgi:hypothetical protein